MAIPSEPWGYEVVGIDAVPLDVWLAAQRTLGHCLNELGLPGLRLVWIRRIPERRAQATVRMEQALAPPAMLRRRSVHGRAVDRTGAVVSRA